MFSKKRVLLALSTIGALVVAAVAYAYFTANGSGTATATVGSSTNIVLKATLEKSLYPGASSKVTFTVDNNGSAAQKVGTISLSSITADAGHSSCVTTLTGEKPAFAMPSVEVNKTYSPGTAQAVTPTGTLTMNDTGVNQDNCQGATLTLTLASN